MKANKVIAVIILVIGFSLLVPIHQYGPVVRLLYASIGLIGLIKLASVFFEPHKFKSTLGLVLYLFSWPGVSSEGFRERQSSPPEDTGSRFLEHWLSFLIGAMVLILSLYLGKGKSFWFNYLALISILFIVHMGLVDVWGDVLKLLGFAPNRMFDRPFLADSLKSFWSHRWNRAFVEMNKIFFVSPLKNKMNASVLAFFIFLVSGVLHEIGISYAADANYGFPLLYFLIQGLGFVLEKKVKLGRIGTLLIVLVPFPLLFAPSFVNLYMGILADSFLGLIERHERAQWISIGLMVGGVLQSSVLIASIQVPGKLNWKEDLAKLSNFNRKVFWTYGGYIFSIIVFMAAISILMSFEEVYGFGFKVWLIFIILFWGARVGIDMFYYSHEDWPEGAEFVIGHICLTTLFSSLILLYSAILIAIW